MSSPIAHLACGHVIHRAAAHASRATGLPSAANGFAAAFFSLAPDLDFAAAWIARDIEGYHNQVSHSLVFVLGIGILGAAVFRAAGRPVRMRAFAFFAFACGAAHLAVDVFTRGRGLMLFWPFSTRRFISPWPLFQGVRWDEGWLSASHFVTLGQDAVFAATLLGLTGWIFRSRSPAPPPRLEAGDKPARGGA